MSEIKPEQLKVQPALNEWNKARTTKGATGIKWVKKTQNN